MSEEAVETIVEGNPAEDEPHALPVGEEDLEEEELDEENVEEEGEEEVEAEKEEHEAEAEEEKVPIEEEEEEEGEIEEEATVAPPVIEEEEEQEEEEIPVDPSAPYDFSDSKEALKAPFELNALQMAEVEAVWNLYQDRTPAYADYPGFITSVELVYLLKCLLVITHTPEQMQELIDFCVRRPDAEGTINFEEFVKMVTIRMRDIPIEEELRLAVEVLDPEKSGIIERNYLSETLETRGYQMHPKSVENFVKEVDVTNDGTVGVEDIVAIMCLDLARDEIIALQDKINPPEVFDEHIADNLLGTQNETQKSQE